MNLSEGEETKGKGKQLSAKRGNRLNQDSTELRRPHGASVNQPAESISTKITDQFGSMQISERRHTDPHRSMLSVDAAEFVPKHSPCAALPQKCSVQDRLKIAREMPPKVPTEPAVTKGHIEDTLQQQYNAKDLQNTRDLQDTHGSVIYSPNIQNNGNGSENYQSYSDSKELEADSDHSFTVFDRLERIIITLISNPGDFDDLIPPFINDFRRAGNMRYIQIIVTNIVEWSITESNFRYNGARFCTYFDETSETIERLLFRDTLHYICKFEIIMQELEWQSPDEKRPNKCPGLILLLAELIAQMDENFAFTLGGLLIQFITNILKKPASNVVKYICQALKLAGKRLEKDKSKSAEIENMMRALTELVTKGQVDTQVGNMVHSVHELRNDNWGRSTSDPDLSETSVTLPLQQVQQALYEPGASNHNSSRTNATSIEILQSSEEPLYGPDGQIIFSAEESKFLQDHLKADDARMFENPYMDDNYDDEIASAYEEFLREKST